MDITLIKYGGCYSNGIYGSRWAVYQITRMHDDGTITFKIVAGAGRRKTETIKRDDFARWAQYEVQLKENDWVRVEPERYRDPE